MPRRPQTVLVHPWAVPALVILLLVLLAVWLQQGPPVAPVPPPPPPPAAAEGYLFCTWNVESLFDDRDDPALKDDMEDWLGNDPVALQSKLSLLANALLAQNGGRGPDLLALVEVENRRAVELLRDALNARLPTPWHYNYLVHRDNLTGRRIEPALLSRLPAEDGPEADSFGIRRILEARVQVAGAPLTVLVSHWTSRLRSGTEAKRAAYADALYNAFLRRYRRDPAADVLLCGDFNDEPDDPSVTQHLHATADVALVRAGGNPPRLLDLMAGRDPARYGTYHYHGQWQIFDHLVVSPGLLDPADWWILPGTLQVENGPTLTAGRDGHPRRFGNARNANPRGPSDHFAVTVRLRVGEEAPTPKTLGPHASYDAPVKKAR